MRVIIPGRPGRAQSARPSSRAGRRLCSILTRSTKCRLAPGPPIASGCLYRTVSTSFTRDRSLNTAAWTKGSKRGQKRLTALLPAAELRRPRVGTFVHPSLHRFPRPRANALGLGVGSAAAGFSSPSRDGLLGDTPGQPWQSSGWRYAGQGTCADVSRRGGNGDEAAVGVR